MEIYLAIDYGEKQTGLALSSGVAITPLPALKTSKEDFMKRLSELIMEKKITTVVWGLCLDPNGNHTGLSSQIYLQAKLLAAKFPYLKMIFWDEYQTTKAAEELYAKVKGRSLSPAKIRQKKEKLDSLSALLILRSYLDSLFPAEDLEECH
ncbi:MAG: Holliday junction resolvase RuvX [Leptospiraceae bacterium]|nr:Holliday junction resolvase RuvX [Leptospiraceae bacterium]MDW8306502.1 Holliday junction resolvase RuvX [Leptospiraceae bacterium]